MHGFKLKFNRNHDVNRQDTGGLRLALTNKQRQKTPVKKPNKQDETIQTCLLQRKRVG